ncbi:Tetraspanin-15 [Orchesella cincta]|uniref:Tetraspanin-15 n=1 Tax=Orchesella cincta TaxID=48709 RepID=A0A1D2NH53_ORCCI|nr:Tetraspanin-15 [Orchesella cincta]
MASFFKASCFIFWLVWLLSFSFLLGTLNFYESHIVQDSAMELNMLLMRIACFVNIFYSFFGCIFMKCDITHITCAVLYILPLGILLPGLSLYGVIQTLGDHKSFIPSTEEMVRLFREHYMAHKQFPNWLRLAEDEAECCGITGPQNYREFFRNETFPMKECLELVHDIPCSCCKIQTTGNKRAYLEASFRSSYGCMTNPNSKRCNDATGSKEWTKSIVTTLMHPDRDNFSIQQKCDKRETEEFKLDMAQFNNTVFITGCYDVLGNMYVEMRTWLLMFFSTLTGCPLAMLIAYLRNFCRSKQLSGQRSDHSLDIETISVLDIPTGFASAGKS